MGSRFIGGYFDKDPPKIVVIGDSIADGLAPYLVPLYNDKKIVNKGTGGNTSTQTAARFAADALAQSPAAVILHVGVNDIKNGVAATTVEANIDAMADACDAAGVILSVDNVGTYVSYTADHIVQLNLLNAWLAGTFATEHPAAIVNDFLSWAEGGSADPTDCVDANFDAECVHPSAAGYALWGAVVRAACP